LHIQKSTLNCIAVTKQSIGHALKNIDLELTQQLLSFPDPDRTDLLDFLGAILKSMIEMEKVFESLTNSIAVRQQKTNQRPN
jgi:hypothetical protein